MKQNQKSNELLWLEDFCLRRSNLQRRGMGNVLLIMLCLLFASTNIYAQKDVTVIGNVTDINGVPLPGVNVIEIGLSNGTTTAFDGNFEITLQSDNSELEFSYLGFSSQKISVGDQTEINVTLEEDAAQLDEVVVVGYGSQKRSDITGAISSVNMKNIEESGANTINQVLEGRTAGVQVTNNIGVPGAESDIVIRGRSSISTNSAPLYVVDGILLDEGVPNPSFATPLNPLQSIAPEDIESIEVLKDASATGIYGSRGANGVILITTKTGKAGKGRMFLNTFASATKIRERVDVLSPQEYAQAYNDSRYGNEGLEPSLFPFDPETGRVETDSLTLIDWQDEYIEVALAKNFQFGASGGNDSNSYYISMGALLVDGIIAGTGTERYNVTGNFKNEVSDWLTATTNINAARIENTFTQGSDGNAGKFGLLNSIFQTRPAFRDASEILTDEGDINQDAEFNGQATPQAWLEEYQDLTLTHTLRVALGLEAQLSNDFRFKSSIGLNNNNNVRQLYFSQNHVRGRVVGGEGRKIDRKAFSYVWDNLLFFNKKINNKHQIDVTTGITYNKYTVNNLNISATGFPDDELLGDNISAGAIQTIIADDYSEYSILSYLARVNYKYKNKLDFTGTFRADGVSKFRPGKQWGYFPSFGLGYNFHNESFIKSSKIVSKLRFRGGWGQVGNSGIPPYSSVDQYNYVRSSDANGVPVTNIQPATKGNPDITWELAEQYNVALEFGFLKNSLSGSIDLYDKTTKNQLFNLPLPSSAGFSNQWINLGEVQNRGIEIQLEANVIQSKDVSFSVGGNISINRNKILDLGREPDEFGRIGFLGNRVNDFSLSTPANIFLEGQPVGLFFGYRTDGIIQEGEEGPDFNGIELSPGDIRFVDVRGEVGDPEPDGVITRADQVIIGDPNPDFLYAFFTDFSYKNFSMSLLFSGSQGADILNGTIKRTNILLSARNPQINQNVDRERYFNAWSPENPSNTNTRIGYESDTDNGQVLDRDIEDGSYLKLQTLNVGYTIKVLDSAISSLKFYVSGQNLIYWTKYPGLNPEIGRTSNGTIGVDHNQFPVAKSVQLGMNLTF